MSQAAAEADAPTPRLAVTLVLEGEDLDMLLAMMQAGGWATPRGVILHGLWMLAKHLDLHPGDVFSLNRKAGPQEQ